MLLVYMSSCYVWLCIQIKVYTVYCPQHIYTLCFTYRYALILQEDMGGAVTDVVAVSCMYIYYVYILCYVYLNINLFYVYSYACCYTPIHVVLE